MARQALSGSPDLGSSWICHAPAGNETPSSGGLWPLFVRNSINIALPVMVCPGVSAAFKDGEELEVDIDSGVVKNLTTGKSLRGEALPQKVPHILKQGGLVEVTKAKLAAKALD